MFVGNEVLKIIFDKYYKSLSVFFLCFYTKNEQLLEKIKKRSLMFRKTYIIKTIKLKRS